MNVLSFDLGASSGRAVLCSFDGKKLGMSEKLRFANKPVNAGGSLYWDALMLLQSIKDGISLCVQDNGDIASLGIDTWGVDFGLLDKDGKLLSNPYYYLDKRTEGIRAELYKSIKKPDLMKMTGGYIHPQGTLCQLLSMVKAQSCQLSCAKDFLMMPSIFEYYLTGEISNEYTAVSTTDMISPLSDNWIGEVIEGIGLPRQMFKKINQPGTLKGGLVRGVKKELGASDIKVISVASHDTASAVAAIPAETDEFLFISSGSCSIIGLNSTEAVADVKAYEEFANEGGINGQKHFVKNVMGMYYYQQCKAAWETKGQNISYQHMQDSASEAKLFRNFIDLEDDELLTPGNMPVKIAEFCKKTNQSIPNTVGETALCITQSIAMFYKHYLEKLDVLCAESHDTIYMVGGGINNKLLCQYTANATKKRVLAVCAEATVVGNALVQLITLNEINGASDRRELVQNSFKSEAYYPEDTGMWDEAYQDFLKIVRKSRES